MTIANKIVHVEFERNRWSCQINRLIDAIYCCIVYKPTLMNILHGIEHVSIVNTCYTCFVMHWSM